jgi:hypothetical protein
MAIEVVKGRTELERENAEDSVLWALNAALDVVRTLNTEVEDDELFSNTDTLFVASMLLSELKKDN